MKVITPPVTESEAWESGVYESEACDENHDVCESDVYD